MSINNISSLSNLSKHYNHDLNTVYKFTNCQIFRNNKIIKENLYIKNNKIIDPMIRFYGKEKDNEIIIDCNDMYIVPGFIDIQINGCYGIDFSTISDCTPLNLNMVRRKLCEAGVTSFLPTIITSSHSNYSSLLPLFKPTTDTNGANILGVHCEGPFISTFKLGCHPKEFSEVPLCINKVMETYSSLENIKLITLAPELNGSPNVIKELKSNDIVVSAGHTMATFKEAEDSVKCGVTLLTHLFNAMVPFHHRDPGIFGLLGADDLIKRDLFYSIIVDGIHAHPASVKIAYNSHPKGIVLVTDAIAAQGLTPGIYHLSNLIVKVTESRAVLADSLDTLAGSIVTLDECFRNFIKFSNASLADACRASSQHPAEVLNLYPKKGSLNYGSDADFVILDKNLQVAATFVGGKLVFCNSNL